ncbi:MAG TPA: serine/threonine-protein kinase [Kofleriaceae bacterium]|jgi:serine/threonine-protein kinase
MSEQFGPWELTALIAVGGLGEVWRSRRAEGREAAVKRLHTHLRNHPEAMRQFAIEQQLSTELPRHPNLVHGVESGDVAGRPYLATELAEGVDLRRRQAPEPDTTGLDLVAAACDAVSHLHVHGWIHGDVNPSNLVIGPGDHPVLVDLGNARRVDDATDRTVRGTHAYMAPEQARGERWTTATDVFALGVIAWELSARRRLFKRDAPWLSVAAVIEEPAPPLADARLRPIVDAALAKDPARRTQTAAELAEQLRALVA